MVLNKYIMKLALKQYINSMRRALELKLTEYNPHPSKLEEYEVFCRTFVKEFKQELDKKLIRTLDSRQ